MLILFLLQEAGAWYDVSSSAIAAFAAITSVVLAPFVNQYIQNRKASRDRIGHMSDTALNINLKEREAAVELMKSAHARDLAIYKRMMREQDVRHEREMIKALVMEEEARQRAHRYGNECNRMMASIYRYDAILAKEGIADITPFVFKSYPEIMAGLDEHVIKFKENLEAEFATRRKQEEEASGELPAAKE